MTDYPYCAGCAHAKQIENLVGHNHPLLKQILDLAQTKVTFYSCFISYSTNDQDFATRLLVDLRNNGVSCWFAPHDLPIGAKMWDAISEAISLRDKLLLIISEHSIASDWVADEVSKAFAEERRRKQIVLFPLRLDDTIFETQEAWAVKLLDQRNICDFTNWNNRNNYRRSFERILVDLKNCLSG